MGMPLSKWRTGVVVCAVLAACGDAAGSMQDESTLNGGTGGGAPHVPTGGTGMPPVAGGSSGGAPSGTGGSPSQGGTSGTVDVDAATMGTEPDAGPDSSTGDAAVDSGGPVVITCPDAALAPGDEAQSLMHD